MYMERNKQVQFLDLGLRAYQSVWDIQEKLFDSIVQIKVSNQKNGENRLTPNFLLFCQHPPVYTLGKNGKMTHLLWTEEDLERHGVQFFKINRGGDITFHGPGQLVGYPILDLDHFFTDIHRYMRYLEEAVIKTCADYGVLAGRIDGLTGVWIDFEEQVRPRKICAMGVKASRWITMHGFAFNVNTDLSYFDHIVPCGIDDKAVTSLSLEVGKQLDLEEVSARMKGHLSQLFEMEIIPFQHEHHLFG